MRLSTPSAKTPAQKEETQYHQQVEGLVTEAMNQLKKGNLEKAVELLQEAMIIIQGNQEFKVREIVLCSEINGFRDYVKKTGNVIKTEEPLLLYIEPVGFRVLRKNAEFFIWLSEDASIIDENGEAVFERTNWVNFNKGFPNPSIPFFITNRVTDIPPGNYTFRFTLKDHYKKTFLTDSFEFIVE